MVFPDFVGEPDVTTGGTEVQGKVGPSGRRRIIRHGTAVAEANIADVAVARRVVDLRELDVRDGSPGSERALCGALLGRIERQESVEGLVIKSAIVRSAARTVRQEAVGDGRADSIAFSVPFDSQPSKSVDLRVRALVEEADGAGAKR